MADPIREALEAAWRASTVDPDDAPEGVICYQREKAAVTIAAFLRALPPRFPLPRPGGQTWGHAHGEMARLAAAVERASKDLPHA